MPAVIAHDLFGREIYEELHSQIGEAREEADAFLIGNQGPDVLFFSNMNPLLRKVWKLGSQMHRSDPDRLIAAFRDAANDLREEVRGIGQAYAAGFACHYALDSTLHPFIYAQQNAICEAGVDGLEKRDGHEVHAEIESELDVLVLSAKRHETIENFNPAERILCADDRTLRVISYMYKRVAAEVYGLDIPKSAFEQSTRAYRAALAALYSPSGVKRAALGRLEKLVRRHSFLQAMSHRNVVLESSPFDNSEHEKWVDPASGKMRTEGFWDLYDAARVKARLFLPFLSTASAEAVGRFTGGLDFNGMPTSAVIMRVEDV